VKRVVGDGIVAYFLRRSSADPGARIMRSNQFRTHVLSVIWIACKFGLVNRETLCVSFGSCGR
jgi:hypothetical protein